MTWHVYSLGTGHFTGQAFTGDAASVAANVPSGCGCIQGVSDWQAQCVDLLTGEVIDWQPPPPAADAMRSWQWDADARRWLPVPTLEARKAERIAPIQAAIDAQEAAQARPVRELLEAMLAGESAPAETRDRMLAIGTEISRLQALRSAVAQAQQQADLDNIPPP